MTKIQTETLKEAIEIILEDGLDDEASAYICHGPPYCGRDWSKEGQTHCPWCYRIDPECKMTAEEICDDIKKIQDGH